MPNSLRRLSMEKEALKFVSASTSSTQETPSPTKLITTCEEVGLFQDLPTSNPFDEVFRRAAEGKYQPTLVISSSPLNTPQVLPQQLEIPQISSGSNSPQGDDTISNLPVIKPKGEELTPAADNTRDEPSINRHGGTCRNEVETPKVIPLRGGCVTPEACVPVNPPASAKPSVALRPIAPAMSVTLRLPHGEVITIPTSCTIDISEEESLAARAGVRAAVTKNFQTRTYKWKKKSVVIGKSSVHDVARCNNESVKERNRMAASRFRERRKLWIGEMEMSMHRYMHENRKLQKEVETLKSQVLALKTFLLEHSACIRYDESERAGAKDVVPAPLRPVIPLINSE